MRYLDYLTKDGDRWDLIAFRHYGDPIGYGRIIAENPDVRILSRLPAGVRLRVPIIESTDQQPLPEELPPWKR